MRASTAYFVGAGTIVAAIAIGLGGGIVAGNIMNPVTSKQGPDTSKMAQRAESAAAPAATNAPPARVNYLTGSQAFGAMIAGVLWLWVNRDLTKCFLAMMLTLAGWLAAVNTANDVINTIQSSMLFGTMEGAKLYREMLAWLTGGLLGGAVGAGLTAFGAGVAATAIRRPEAWMLIVMVGAITGLLLYSAALLDAIVVLFVPWQVAVSTAIAYGLTTRDGFRT